MNFKSAHFVGIGGSGMSGIARIMLDRGIEVSGCDLRESNAIGILRTMGAKIDIGHSVDHLHGVDVVIATSALDSKNPELNSKVPTISRAQALAQLMEGRRSVAVAGTHGKTTTTSMITVCLQQAKMDPTFVIGGALTSSGSNAHSGRGSIFIAEADESDGSFVEYHPDYAIITNIELDHVDHFQDITSIDDAFEGFLSTVKGAVVACGDDPGVKRLQRRTSRPIITYGREASNTFRLEDVALHPRGSRAAIYRGQEKIAEIMINVPGYHNLLNGSAAFIMGRELGGESSDLLQGLARFSGARRRFEVKGSVRGITVIDDYGHHPTEISATLHAARGYIDNGRLHVIFQPHRYSRTKRFAEEFAQSLDLADSVILLDVYAASEPEIPGVNSGLIARSLSPSKVHWEHSMVDAIDRVVSIAQPGDLIITLGAGDVSTLAPAIVDQLHEGK
jgi:UDP-N-acetylmuramate--alanine ligase